MAAGSDVAESEAPRGGGRGFRPWLERGLFVLVLAAVGAWHFGLLGPGRQTCVVVVDGNPAVVMASRKAANQLLAHIKEQAGKIDIAQFAQQVTLYPVDPQRNPPVSDVEAMKILRPKLTVVMPGAGLFVNGKLFAGLPSREEAVEAFTLLLKELSPPDPDLTRAFKERVSIKEGLLPISSYTPNAQAVLDRVHEAMNARATYTVKGGDSPWKIATAYGISIADVKRANPDVDFTRLQAGQELVVPTGKSPLTVVAWKEMLVPVGRSGQTQTVRVIYENGAEVQRYVTRRPRRAHTEEATSHRVRRSRSSRSRPTTPQRRAPGDESVTVQIPVPAPAPEPPPAATPPAEEPSTQP